MPVMIHEPLTVLLMEDSLDDERLALRALRSCGLPLCVRVARDGEQGLRALGLLGPSDDRGSRAPDLILSDLKMPRFNGDEVLRLARAEGRLRHVPYVIFSSSDDVSDVARCLELGASDYCTKPVGFEEYVECVGAITRRWLSAADRKREPFCVVEAPTPEREAAAS